MKTKLTTAIFMCILINAFNSTISKAQYIDDFEGGNNGWTIMALNSQSSLWQMGMPNFGLTNTTHSGTHAWDIDLNAAYKNNSYAILISPVFNFTNVSNATLSFWRNNNCESNWDGTRMEYTIDGGITWSILGGIGSGVNWYSTNINSSGLPAWCGNSQGWVQSSYNLSMLDSVTTPVQFRYVFTSDASVSTDGFSIDDFSIDQVPPPTQGPAFTFNCITNQSLPCSGNYNGYFSVYGSATGLINGDSLNININFGDGVDSTFVIVVNNGCYFSFLTHGYTSNGQYSIQLIVNGPGGINDTITQYNQIVFPSCGNIEGRLYYDANANCLFDSTDVPLKVFPVKIYQNGTFLSNSFTDIIGMYSFNVPAGFTYTVLVDTNNLNGFNIVCPSSGIYTVTALPSINNDFAFSCGQGFDLFGSIYTPGAVPGFSTHVNIYYGNKRCFPMSGTVTLIIPAGLSFLVTPAGATISGDTMVWSFANLTNYNSTIWSNYLQVIVQVDSTLQIGDTICYQLMVDPISGDYDSTNNYILFCTAITSSFDPNEKRVEPKGISSAGLVAPNTNFTYTINFQNTGTALAHNVSILDTLDADLDPATLQILNATHQMTVDYLPGNILRFNFYNIMLPDSNANEPLSHGAFQYSIAARAGLLQGTQIKNTAYIYFDFNQAVVTNTTLNTIDIALSIAENSFNNSFIIYPQPANDFFNLRSDNSLTGELKIFDVKGKLCKQLMVNNTSTVSTKDLNGGIYYITLQTQTKTLTNKLVIIK